MVTGGAGFIGSALVRHFARVFGIRGRPWTEETDAITRALAGAQQGKASHVA